MPNSIKFQRFFLAQFSVRFVISGENPGITVLKCIPGVNSGVWPRGGEKSQVGGGAERRFVHNLVGSVHMTRIPSSPQ